MPALRQDFGAVPFLQLQWATPWNMFSEYGLNVGALIITIGFSGFLIN